MSAQPAAQHIRLVREAVCSKCNTKNSSNNHFCRVCGREINTAADELPPEKCLHKSVRQSNLHRYNYCPTCCEKITSISTDEEGIMI